MIRLALFLVLLATAAEAAAPTFRACGTTAGGVGTPSPGVPAGTDTGDLLIMPCETRDNEACSASGWTAAGQNSGQASGAGTGSRATLLYKIAESATPATTLDDAGDHAIGHVCAIEVGTFDTGSPVQFFASEARNVAATAISITGTTTTVDDCLVFYVSTDEVDGGAGDGTACSSMADASLASIVETTDTNKTNGDGGAICMGRGTLATAGATGTWTVTHAASGVGGELVFAVCATPPAASRRVLIVQ